jgi:hypothetical protein
VPAQLSGGQQRDAYQARRIYASCSCEERSSPFG